MNDETVVEVYLYDTCSLACGYCTLAESGMVLDRSQLDKLKDRDTIASILSFFNERRRPASGWHYVLTGGEPLLMPTFEHFCDGAFNAGDRVSLYTNISIPQSHLRFRYLLSDGFPRFGYIMASYHPESSKDPNAFFEKVRLLKNAGHRIVVRLVGHPSRLTEIPILQERCRKLDVSLYTTALFSNNYPAAYSQDEREALVKSFSSISQRIQLEGGADVSGTRCNAGSKLICVNFQTGDITPCITVGKPVLGNVYEKTFREVRGSIKCPEERHVCSCDTHFQQAVIVGIDDHARFEEISAGFVTPLASSEQELICDSQGVVFAGAVLRQGNVDDDSRLSFSMTELRERYRETKNAGRIRTVARRVLRFLGRFRRKGRRASDAA